MLRLVVLPLLLVPALASATQWTVDATAAAGGNGSSAKPFKTLNQVLAVLSTGDTVVVSAGTYNETVSFWQIQAGSGGWTTIKAAPGASPVIDGGGGAGFVLQAGETAKMAFEGLTIRNGTGAGILFHKAHDGKVVNCTTKNVESGVVFYYSNNGEVTGCDLEGGVSGKATDGTVVKESQIHGSTGNGIYLHADSKNCKYVNNVVYDNTPNNIYIDTSSNMTVDRNLIYFTGTPPAEHAGIQMADETYDNVTVPRLDTITITNNVLIHNRHGILFWQGDYPGQSGMKNVRITNNTVLNSVEAALIWDAGPHSATVQNNIFADDGTGSASLLLLAKSTTGVTLDHNLWNMPWVPDFIQWGGSAMTHYAWTQATSQGTGDVLADPKLAGWTPPASSARPQSGSAAIDNGVALTFVTHDFDGTARPVGSAYDIGAFEVSSVVTPDGAPLVDGASAGDASPTADGSTTTDLGSVDGPSGGGDDSGCGCRTANRAPQGSVVSLLLGLIALTAIARASRMR